VSHCWFAGIPMWGMFTRAHKQQLRDHYRNVIRYTEMSDADKARRSRAGQRQLLRNRKRLRDDRRRQAGQEASDRAIRLIAWARQWNASIGRAWF
jgi:hypothetical protein